MGECAAHHPERTIICVLDEGHRREHMARDGMETVMWENQEAPPEPLPSHLTRSAKTDQMTGIVQRRRERESVSEPHTYVREGARDTEASAAFRALPRSGTKRWEVLFFIGQAGEVGATDEEIQTRLGMHHNTQTPRRLELEQGGWIEDSGVRRTTATGSEAIVWKLTPDGQERWSQRA